MSNSRDIWEETTLGSIFKQRKEKGHNEEDLLSVTGDKGIVRRDSLDRRDTSNNDKSKYLLVEKGDIAYNTMRMWQGVSGVSSYRGIVSPAYTVCSPTTKIDSKYAGYLLKDPAMISLFKKSSQGLVSDTWNLKYEKFAQIPCSIPPIPEQNKITEILSEIDQLILNKKSLLKKIQLISKAHIFHQIYNFHNHKHFKNSCFGKIPINWEIKTLNQVGDFKNGINKPKEAFGRGTKFVNISDAYLEELDVNALDRLEVSLKEIDEYKLQKGDLVFVRSSVKLQGVGVPTVFKESNEEVLFCGFMIRFRLKQQEINPFYLKEYLLTDNARIRIERVATGGANININQQSLGDFKILLPSLNEQDFIIRTNLKLKKHIKELITQVNKLNFLKLSLSQKLLNGQVRVKI